ncbi:MAG: hypothetical protein ABIQ59_18440 [Nocardioidaceae bacterium]
MSDLSGYVGLDAAAARAKAGDTRWTLRVYTRGAVLTMDLRRDRLNLELGDDGLVTRAWVG